jgi:hypothetical protein
MYNHSGAEHGSLLWLSVCLVAWLHLGVFETCQMENFRTITKLSIQIDFV